jgi:hypothetical protein
MTQIYNIWHSSNRSKPPFKKYVERKYWFKEEISTYYWSEHDIESNKYVILQFMECNLLYDSFMQRDYKW